MRAEHRSRTAEAAAATRARHHRHDSPRIFDDPYALALTSPGWRRIVESRVLCWLVYRIMLGRMRGGDAQVIGRSRLAEDALERALERGIAQYVIVGAGLDSFALRRPDLRETVRVFELDHPATQSAKREKLAALGLEEPGHLEFVTVDFEQETLASALARSRFEARTPAFFSWLGTTYYLSNDAVLRTLDSIARGSAAGSEVVFDYKLVTELLTPEQARVVERVENFTARRGEPMLGKFSPDKLAADLDRLGLDVVEDLSGEQLRARYFAHLGPEAGPPPSSRFAHVRVRGGG